MKDRLVLTLAEEFGRHRASEYVHIGIPLPRGIFYEPGQINLHTADRQSVQATIISTALWPDDSIKWCLACFAISIDADQEKEILVSRQEIAPQSDNMAPLVSDSGNQIDIKTKNYNFRLNRENFNFIEQILSGEKPVTKNGFCRLVTESGGNLQARVDQYQFNTTRHGSQPVYTELALAGRFLGNSQAPSLNFEAKLIFYFETDRVKGEITLHNPERAIHPGGLWDLGDENSVFLKDFSIGLEVPEISELQWQLEPEQDWLRSSEPKLKIYQESSGGSNWKSPNHKNRHNKVVFDIKGYRCETEGSTVTGDRADPVISLLGTDTRLNFKVHNFWQNFPKAVSVANNKLEAGLFPEQFPDEIELQAGEKKTHQFSLSIGDQIDPFCEVVSPLTKKFDLNWIRECHIFPVEYIDNRTDPIRQIIDEGLSGENDFFVKRELIDEYGWRNFGDLYADHEADLQTGDDTFVSHYNNQYDPVFGFLMQYLISGDKGWFELADDLARHITDIDIYHTVKDRDEYNGGAFWHTDHYLDAATSSHRSHSRFHDYQYEGHAGGGGPGGQHCYTAGLLLHYLITGSEPSKNAVFQLCQWITHFYEAPDSILGLMVALKNSSNIDRKNLITGQYPFDRGTAYYVNTLLDKFYLSRDRKDLNQVEHIIRYTVSPTDNIEDRELNDVENRWYYTVFLQSIIRYLKVKKEYDEIDESFYYAKDTLIKYSKWMLENEYPYLEKPEILEFPNHTWTAQDIRKVHIFYNAALYSNHDSDAYLRKADEFYQYIASKLECEPTRTYTRILSLLMQCPISYHRIKESVTPITDNEQEQLYIPVNRSGTLFKLTNICSAFFKSLKTLSIKKEFQWLDRRMQLVSKIRDRFK